MAKPKAETTKSAASKWADEIIRPIGLNASVEDAIAYEPAPIRTLGEYSDVIIYAIDHIRYLWSYTGSKCRQSVGEDFVDSYITQALAKFDDAWHRLVYVPNADQEFATSEWCRAAVSAVTPLVRPSEPWGVATSAHTRGREAIAWFHMCVLCSLDHQDFAAVAQRALMRQHTGAALSLATGTNWSPPDVVRKTVGQLEPSVDFNVFDEIKAMILRERAMIQERLDVSLPSVASKTEIISSQVVLPCDETQHQSKPAIERTIEQIEQKTPALDTDNDEWITARVYQNEWNKSPTIDELRNMRSKGEKHPSGLFGRHKVAGRWVRWRKKEIKTQAYYLVKDLGPKHSRRK
ncbi:MAG: hypothetical protein KDA63_00555 [Planctomycetales bacterium]|nr:hypothetical protein [Planctomycetales bacterium]